MPHVCHAHAACESPAKRLGRHLQACGAVAEWSKALAWKVSIRQKRIEGSNPSRSAIHPRKTKVFWLKGANYLDFFLSLGFTVFRSFSSHSGL